ncbi:hypothetical protein E5161_12435 [Cohnella pontilimi]|uniref:DUF4179 domain-containing protein n=1 Tax=Cohnella pontilimi TaxID=2564100 RepID=A0A4U0FAZ1_9BACL|nr:hypothetical protein [Cohnella pontilimi]TJY41993.1 hypothetical protein E5161_12435 [Cohnella pontilimi]
MQNRDEDKWLFDWTDSEDPQELKGLSSVQPDEETGPDDKAWHRMKKRTFEKLGYPERENDLQASEPLMQENRRSRRRVVGKWLAAVSAAAVICMLLISISPDVQAQLKKALQFIPGFGYVQQKDDSAQPVFVLQKPVEFQGEYDTVTIDGLVIRSTGGEIALSGDDLSDKTDDSIILSTAHGEYEFKRGSASWGSGGPWEAGYYYQGQIPITALSQVKLRFGNSVVPLDLEEAQSAENMISFGPSDTQNGIRITGVVTRLDGQRVKVNLLTQLPQLQIVDSFSKEPITGEQKLEVTDSNGKMYEVLKDIGFVKPRDILFDDSTGGAEHYTLTIPYIRVEDMGVQHEKVTLPVPQQGSQNIHVTSALDGFPVDFTQVERVNERTVRVSVDVHFDAAQSKTLQSYRLFDQDGFGISHTSKINEQTRALEFEWLDVEPGQKEITFYMGEPQIVIKGPWILRDLH